MASLQKTFRGDLSTAIAGKIWEAIKGADERRKLDESKASEEVKKEAVKVKKDDPNSIAVQDKGLSETIVKIFTPLDGKLLQVKNRVSNLSAKANIIAGGVADTQKLLVSQNQFLEDKFDLILQNIGSISAIDKQREAEAAYDDLENQLEKGMDLSGTFAYEKTNTGSYGVLGKVLSGILGNRFTARLIGQISKALIPKGIRSRARLLRKALLPTRRFARKLTKPGNYIIRRVVQPFFIHTLKTIGRGAIKQFFRRDVAGRAIIRAFGKGFGRAALLADPKTMKVFKTLAQSKPARETAATVGGRGAGRVISKKFAPKLAPTTADIVAQRIINFKTYQETVKKSAAAMAKRNIKPPNKLISAIQEGILSRALRNPKVQEAILKKLGPGGMKRLGIKATAGGVKGGFPLFGTAYGAIEGIARLIGGDPKGMMLSFGSAIPFAGWGFAIIDILRDIDREAYTEHIEPNFTNLTDENFANFFQDALGISPDQYERGNVNISSPSGMGSSINAISEILGVTKAFGQATGFGAEVQGLVGEAGLGSYPTGKSDYSFDVSGNVGGGNIEQIQSKEAELREKRRYKEEEKKKEDDEDTTDEVKTNPMMDRVRDFTGGEVGDGVFTLPFGVEIPNIFHRGGGGIGGDDTIQATTPIMGGDGATIEFWGQQGRDLSGEPGVDFSYKDYKSNYNLFPGYVLETGLLYGARYGNVVVVRSTDPSNGLEFDSLYSHFPDGGMAVKPGQVVSAGEYLGAVGFVSVDTPGVPKMQPNNAGNMSGWHTSVDFFEPGSAARYRNLSVIQNLVTGADGQTPVGLLDKLKPPAKSSNQSSLNSIGANTKLASTMTNMVENGSSERLMTQREISNRLPIVILNNQIIKSSTTAINIGSNNTEDNFFEAYNLARHTV